MECKKGFSHASKVLIVEDLNSNILSPQLPECKLLDSFIDGFDLCAMFKGPTKITESTSTHLDVFLTNCSFSFTDVLVKPIGFSDHHIVMGTYLARRIHPPRTHKVISARNYKKLDSNLLCDLFTDTAWDVVFSFDNVSDTVQCFTAVLL